MPLKPSCTTGRFSRSLGIVLLVALFVAWLASSSKAEEKKKTSFYDRVRPALVEVLVDGRLCGSGCFVDSDGTVLSSSHLFPRPGMRIELLSVVVGRHEAEVLAIDKGHDLALLKLKFDDEKEKPKTASLDLANRLPEVGTELFQFGTPLFRRGIVQRGSAARNETAFEYLSDQKAYVEILHVAATLQRGTSGGPWVDETGKLVGLQSGVMSVNEVPVGMAFMVPVGAIREFLASRTTAATPCLGMALEELWQQTADFIAHFPQGTEGLVVKLLEPKGPAARAGFQEMDLITAVDGKPVAEVGPLLRHVRSKKPTEKVSLTVRLPHGSGDREAVVSLGLLETVWTKAKPAKPACPSSKNLDRNPLPSKE